MGTGNNDVGMETSIASAATLSADAVKRSARCQGAMSQQGYGWHGNECYPQKLVRLVGYREPQARSEAWDRLRLKRAKQPADSAT